MDQIKLSEHFGLEEFLDPESYAGLEKLVAIGEYLRKHSGQSITVNNWKPGGQYRYSGFRPPQCPVGAPGSEHKKFNAADYKMGKWPGDAMQVFVRSHAKELYEMGVRRMEHISLTPTWLHLDCKEHGEKCIKVIDLTKVVSVIDV